MVHNDSKQDFAYSITGATLGDHMYIPPRRSRLSWLPGWQQIPERSRACSNYEWQTGSCCSTQEIQKATDEMGGVTYLMGVQER